MNTLELLEVIFVFAGGLGMFLFGMNMMGDGLQKSAGNKLKRLLGYLTSNRLMAILVGIIVTGIIQSSSATTVMVVGFVNAGIMNFFKQPELLWVPILEPRLHLGLSP